MSETLVTMFTVERFFSSVNTLVALQVRQHTETLVTMFTVIRFFYGVDTLVFLQVT